MSHCTSRRQLRIANSNQLLHPSQIEEGIEIGVVNLIKPTPQRERTLQAVAALAFSYGRNAGEGRFAAGKRGWQFSTPHGLLPDWRGIVNSVGGHGVWVDLTGTRGDNNDPFSYMDQSLEALPDVVHPIRQHCTLQSIGLAALASTNSALREEAGRWIPAATIRLS